MANGINDETLKDLADNLAVDDNLPKLGLKLGFTQNKVDQYMRINKKNDTSEGTSKMLFDWKKKTSKSEQIYILVKALIASDLMAFAEETFPEEARRQTSHQEEIPAASSASNTDSSNPMDPDRVVSDKELMTLAGKLPADSSLSSPSSEIDFHNKLKEVARRVRSNGEIDTLGINLGFTPDDIEGFIANNHKTHRVTTDGTMDMLKSWQKKQKASTQEADLKSALVKSGQIRLAEDLFPSSQ